MTLQNRFMGWRLFYQDWGSTQSTKVHEFVMNDNEIYYSFWTGRFHFSRSCSKPIRRCTGAICGIVTKLTGRFTLRYQQINVILITSVVQMPYAIPSTEHVNAWKDSYPNLQRVGIS
jgi:hypothetical protein